MTPDPSGSDGTSDSDSTSQTDVNSERPAGIETNEAARRDAGRRDSAKTQLFWLAVGLVVIGLGLALWKYMVLDVPLLQSEADKAWRIEAEVTCVADGRPVEVALAIPSEGPEYRVLSESEGSSGYGFRIEERDGHRRAVWTKRDPRGEQTFFFRSTVFDVVGSSGGQVAPPPDLLNRAIFPDDVRGTAETLVADARRRSAGPSSLAAMLVRNVRQRDDELAVRRLFGETTRSDLGQGTETVETLVNLMALAGVHARLARGLVLDDGARRQPLRAVLEVYEDGQWMMVDPMNGQIGIPPKFVLWQRGGQSLLDVEGASNSRIRVAAIETVLPNRLRALERSKTIGDTPFLFSLHDLPIEDQNVFKIFALIPIGALILCICRNIIGLPTSGTFMPLLIALAFQETSLVGGLILFVMIVGTGLLIRGYLSNLNLLLVPRISAVVVSVIVLMGVFVIFGQQSGFRTGMSITFFPFIVIAWTIERLSTVWEENGPADAIKQCGGSLLVAVFVFLLWQIQWLQDLLYAYAELNLVILALILAVGSYTGYRLSELARFQPLAEAEDPLLAAGGDASG